MVKRLTINSILLSKINRVSFAYQHGRRANNNHMDDDQVYCVAKADDEFKSQQRRAILQNLLLFFVCIRISQDRKAWRKEQLAYEHYILEGHGIKHRFRC